MKSLERLLFKGWSQDLIVSIDSGRHSRDENIFRCSLFLVKLLRNRNSLQNFLKRGCGQKKAHLLIVDGGKGVDSIHAFNTRDIRIPRSTGECIDTEGEFGAA